VKLVTISDEEQRAYLRLKEEHSKIGKGEIERIIVCLERGYLFSSFDKRALAVAKELGVNLITAGTVFKGLIVKGIAMKRRKRFLELSEILKPQIIGNWIYPCKNAVC
jgi:predicted nucleic acid-binding protein